MNPNFFRRATALVGCVVLSVSLGLACSSTTPAPVEPVDVSGSCDAIASACHPYKTDIGRSCHDLGHDGDDTKCGPKKAECIAACPPRPAEDAGADAASADGGDSGPPTDPVCVAHCACLEGACKGRTGYPFTAAGTCLTACAAWSSAERTCFPKWCKQAEVTPSSHVCEHAWGGNGLDECDSL